MFFLKIWNFLKIKFKKKDPIADELPENIIYFNEYSHYRLKFNADKNMYQKVLEYQEENID